MLEYFRRMLSELTGKKFSTKTNIFANFLGNAVLTVFSILFVPIYLQYIGIEAYGLIGFFASFQTILSVMDLGISLTLTRELAVRDGIADKGQESRNLVKTLEMIYWGIAVMLGIFSIALVPVLSDWLNPNNLSSETVSSSLLIMSIALILQFPVTFYLCGLTGLQKQVLSSIVTIFFSIFRYLGAWVVLHFVSSAPQSFFTWQAVSSAFQVSVMAISLWLTLPKASEKSRFQKNLVADIWKFMTGMGGISILSVLLLQFDKIILGRILSLEAFGYYAIAGLAATSLYRIVYPIFLAYYPKLSQLAGSGAENDLNNTYHQGCQIMSVFILPIAVMFILFSEEIMFLWQGNAETVRQTSLLVSLLTIAYALNSLVFMPYALQLAKGQTKLYFYTLLISLLISLPAMGCAGLSFGAIGAAAVLIAVFALLTILLMALVNRTIIKGQLRKWSAEDVGLPLLSAVVSGFAGRVLFSENTSLPWLIIQLGLIFVAVFSATSLMTPYPRKWILQKFFSLSGLQ